MCQQIPKVKLNNMEKIAFIRDHYLDTVIGEEIYPQVTNITYEDNPLTVVSDFFFRKATKTFDAICVLSETGFAEDAQVLGRTLFELCVHLLTIVAPTSIEQRRLKAECFIYDAERQRVEKWKELTSLKQQGKCLSWITQIEAQNPVLQQVTMPQGFVPLKNFKTMATELGGEWECWYHSLYWSVSKLTHPSGLGSYTYILENDEEAELSGSIAIGLTMHYLLTEAVLTLLELETLRPSLEASMKNVLAHIRD
jgi:hypothetical protein